MKRFIASLLFVAFAICGFAQQVHYLSGEDASTAVDWEFKVSDGRNSGFWTSIPVPSNWETEGFGYYLYGMDKMENRTAPVGFYRHSFDYTPKANKRYFIVFQSSMTDTKVTLNNKEIGLHQGGFTEFKFESYKMVKTCWKWKLTVHQAMNPLWKLSVMPITGCSAEFFVPFLSRRFRTNLLNMLPLMPK